MVNYNDILKVVEDYVEKCKATARAKNIGKSNQKEKIGTTEEKATYNDYYSDEWADFKKRI